MGEYFLIIFVIVQRLTHRRRLLIVIIATDCSGVMILRFEKFEDIQAWQNARQLCVQIYKSTAQKPFANNYGLRNQIQRAAVSVMSNISEGFGRRGNNEFIRFLNIAHGSLQEVQSQLYIALDLEYISHDQHEILLNQAQKTAKLIGGLYRYLKYENQ